MKTYGWDTVSAVTIERANQALAASHDSLLPTFSWSMAGYKLDGRFGNWQIVPGGAGKLLHVELPIEAGRLIDSTRKTYELGGVSVVVEVQLGLLPDRTDSNKQNLQFSFKAVGDTPGDSDPGLVTLRQVKDPQNRLPEATRRILGDAIAQTLVANAANVSFLFASVSLVRTGDRSWLTPSKSDYCYIELDGGKHAFLAILAVTTDRDIGRLERKVDPSLLNGAGSVFFALSKLMFLQHVIQPVLSSVFDTGADTFRYNADAQAIQNTAPFGTPAVKSGLIWYRPRVEHLLITVQESSLVCSTTGSCDMGLDITCTFGVHAQNTLQYGATTKAVSFAKDPSPTVQHDFHIPWYDYLVPGINLIGDLILAIVVPLIADGIADGMQQNANDLSLAREPPESVQWSGMSAFSVTNAGLNDSFWMRGELS